MLSRIALLCYFAGMHRVYLDYNATSPLREEARQALAAHLDLPPGNPSSVHAFGHRARMAVEAARGQVSRLLGADHEEVVFTGGGTEANNLALYGAALGAPPGARRIVASAFEHPSVAAVLDDLAERGFEVIRVSPGRSGVVDAGAILEPAAPGKTAVVSLMLANNEVGTLQPVAEVGRALRPRGILFHCDAAQAAGKVRVDVGQLHVDLLSVAAHKLGGPQGVGALYVRRGVRLRQHLRGGGQELHRRPGTENVPAIAGFGAAASAVAQDNGAQQMSGLRERLETLALRQGLASRINGAGSPRVPNTSSLAFEGISGEALVIALDLEGIAVSAGAACSAGTIRRSPTLDAMGLPREATSSIRVSLGPGTTAGDIDHFVAMLERVLSRCRELIPAARTRGRA